MSSVVSLKDSSQLIPSHFSKEHSINLVSKQFREIQYSLLFKSQEFKNTLNAFENESQQNDYFGYFAEHFSISDETLSSIMLYTEKQLEKDRHPLCNHNEALPSVVKILPEAEDLFENQILQIAILNHKKIHATICLELFRPDKAKAVALPLQAKNFDHFVNQLYQIALKKEWTVSRYLREVISNHNKSV